MWCKRTGERGQEWNDTHEVIIESEVNRWIEPTASQSQMNEGPYSWTPGLWAEIYPLFFWPPIVQIVPCAGLSTHAVFSDKARPGGPGRCAAFGGLIMPSGRLREAFGDASADRSLLGLYGLCVCHPAAERQRQNCFLVDWRHSQRHPPPPPWIDWAGQRDKIRREMELRRNKG